MSAGVIPIDRAQPQEGAMAPHDIDAETSVLSACLVGDGAFERVHGQLLHAHFYLRQHAYAFEAMVRVNARGEPIDAQTVASELKVMGRHEVGGIKYLTGILNAAPALAPKALDAYARAVRESARARDVIATCQRIVAMGYVEHGDHAAYVAEAERAVVDVARRGREPAAEQNLDVLREIIADITKRSAAAARGDRERVVTGLPTGLESYDVLTNGLHGGEVTVVAARPGVGKTAISLQIAAHVAGPLPGDARAPIGVVFFQLDNMTRKECLTRILSSRAQVDQGAMKTGRLDAEAWNRLTSVSDEIHRWPLVIDDRKRVNALEIRARTHRLVGDPRLGKAPLGLVVIDYFQKIAPSPHMVRARKHEYLAEAAEGIGHMAGELKIPVLLLAQLNRGFEERGGDPELRDIADCGEVEKEAQVVTFLVAPKAKKRGTVRDGDDTTRTMILQKQRNGRRTGRVNLEFRGALARFRDVDAEDTPEWVKRAPLGAGDGATYQRQTDEEAIDGTY